MSVPPQFLSELWARQLLVISGCTFLIYDYLLTLSLEVDHIWSVRWSPMKAIFLLYRYGNLIGQSIIGLEELGILSHGSNKFCDFFQFFLVSFTIICPELIHIIVLVRVWAIGGCKYSVAVFLISIYAFYLVAVIALEVYAMASSHTVSRFAYLEETRVCVEFAPRSGLTLFLVAILMDMIVFALMGHSLYKLHRGSPSLRHSPLLHILMRDGIMFYSVSVLNNAFGIFTWVVYGNDPRTFFEVAITFPLFSIVGQRLVLNLRGLRPRNYTPHDISREVDRQIAQMRNLSFWQSDHLPSDDHLDRGRGSRNRLTRVDESLLLDDLSPSGSQVVGTDEEIYRCRHGSSATEGGPT